MNSRLAWAFALAALTAGAQSPGDRLYIGNAAGVGEVNRIAPGSVAQYSLSFNTPPPILGSTITLTLTQPGQPDRPLEFRDGTVLSGRFYVPAEAQPGPASIRLEAEGYRLTSPVDVVETAPALYGIDFSRVLASQRAPSFEPLQLTRPARPGDTLTVWGTGLGLATQSDVQASLNGQPLRVEYAGPAPGQRGLDQYNLTIPADASVEPACYARLVVTARNVTAPPGYLPVGAPTGACRHPLNLTDAQLKTLDQGGAVPLAHFSMTSYATGLSLLLGVDFTQLERREFATADVTNQGAAIIAMQSSYVPAPVTGACTVSTGATTVGQIGGAQIPASTPPPSLGATVRLAGPAQSYELTRPPNSGSPWFDSVGYYLELPTAPGVTYFDQLAPTAFPPGTWSFSGEGDASLQPFRIDTDIPGPIRFRNPEALRSIDRTRDLTLQWETESMRASDALQIAVSGPQPGTSVACSVRALDGTLTIPAALLAQLPAATGRVNPPLLSVGYVRPLDVRSLPRRDADPLPALLDWSAYTSIPVELR